MKSQYDCVVIGGGPGGCSAAAIVAEAGCDTLLIEREALPRFHVGESLMPETFAAQRLIDRSHPHERLAGQESVQFVTHKGTESEPFFFREHDDRDCSEWQVERANLTRCCLTVLRNWVPTVMTARGLLTSGLMSRGPHVAWLSNWRTMN